MGQAAAADDNRRVDVGLNKQGGQDSASVVEGPTAAAILQQDGAVVTQENQKDYNAEIKALNTRVRKPSFSAATMVSVSGHRGIHIVLPAAASKATSAGAIQDIQGCIIDMSTPASEVPFAGLALTNLGTSIVVTGSVSGPVHVTGVSDSILVVASRQVRIHECKNVDMYLHCTSHPIIEDCKGMRFAPIPECYVCIPPHPHPPRYE